VEEKSNSASALLEGGFSSSQREQPWYQKLLVMLYLWLMPPLSALAGIYLVPLALKPIGIVIPHETKQVGSFTFASGISSGSLSILIFGVLACVEHCYLQEESLRKLDNWIADHFHRALGLYVIAITPSLAVLTRVMLDQLQKEEHLLSFEQLGLVSGVGAIGSVLVIALLHGTVHNLINTSCHSSDSDDVGLYHKLPA